MDILINIIHLLMKEKVPSVGNIKIIHPSSHMRTLNLVDLINTVQNLNRIQAIL